MAIKGKKRSRDRGSQGVRRPAAAPRPNVGGRRDHQWYHSPLNVGVVIIFGLVAIGILIALIVDIRSEASDKDAKKEALETYTDAVRGPLELAASPASQMSLIGTTPRGKDLKDLGQDAEDWVTELQEAQAQLAQTFPEESTGGVNQLFNESIALYISAANTMATLPEIEDGDLRQEIFNQAATVRDTATAVFTSAITVLDQLRDDVGIGTSGIRAPIAQAPAPEDPALEDPLNPEGDPAADNESTVVIPGDEEADQEDGGQEGDAEGGGGGG